MSVERPRVRLSELQITAATNGGGLRCPRCGCTDLRVWRTRHRNDHVYRERKCRHCGHLVITQERAT